MPAESLNHYTILVRDLERTKDFYCDVVGLTVGDRPPLPFPGYWLYCGGVPTVHLIGYRPQNPTFADGPSYPAPTGRLDHIAFSCTGLKAMRDSLTSRGLRFEERVLPRLNMTQLFYLDPDGISVECNFPAEETENRAGSGYESGTA
ncbi:VOC family protein [Rhodopila sp.]|jgi:catechol 2,3-dioxygenase-like lactoylglutathione lyase family enzyme|uniref:VOC family protein n=1 Tax=Rhodopila sp. TaxID=2480087 RepID=UPI002BF0AB88|nr:VOC family protein [Rhodopila sp.]HVZ10344.1 VOC family protein [Rhodopila sp.]